MAVRGDGECRFYGTGRVHHNQEPRMRRCAQPLELNGEKVQSLEGVGWRHASSLCCCVCERNGVARVKIEASDSDGRGNGTAKGLEEEVGGRLAPGAGKVVFALTARRKEVAGGRGEGGGRSGRK